MISIVIISKDEPALDQTLTAVRSQVEHLAEPAEILVIDASDGRLDHIRDAHATAVRWIRFERPTGVRITIPHQRNIGVRAARGDVIVFTDSGCYPDPEWLAKIIGPLRAAENITAGLTLAAAEGVDPYQQNAQHDPSDSPSDVYLRECPTINMAFRRAAFDAIGGFDEQFAYGSDSDFSWRLVDAGFRILLVPDAVIRHDWGTRRRQLRRSYLYGRARWRLYRKHRSRRKRLLRDDPVVVVYPLFLLGLVPVIIISPAYPALLLYLLLLLVPAWRNRSADVAAVLADHLAYGAGVLVELVA